VAVMVGDRHYDIAGAQQNGMGAIGVTWGFGTEEELTEAGANELCNKPSDLASQTRLLLPPLPSAAASGPTK
jgi:phosphoglycolate phosphatase